MGQKEGIFSFMPFMKGIASWFWIAEPLLFALLCFAASAVIRQKTLQYLCIFAASFFLTFAAAEVYFTLQPVGQRGLKCDSRDSVYVKSGQATHLYEQISRTPDPVLGYGPAAGGKIRVASRCTYGNELVYDVLYSRDEEGRRITPDRGDKADTAILLFICSCTVGEGVNDQETFAWQLGAMLGEKFQVFNYGFHGYGSHHMLALIESGRLDAIVRRYTQTYALFLTISDHVERTAGHRPFHVGPRYILENGVLTYAGMFTHAVDKLFAGSRVYEQIKPAYYRWLGYDRAFNTHVAIVTKSMHELAARYQAHALTVIYPDFLRIEPILRAQGVRTLSLAGVMPDYVSTPEKYVLKVKVDGHPNALAHTRIAEALSEYILKNAQAAGERQ
jgi:hypothetical protein